MAIGLPSWLLELNRRRQRPSSGRRACRHARAGAQQELRVLLRYAPAEAQARRVPGQGLGHAGHAEDDDVRRARRRDLRPRRQDAHQWGWAGTNCLGLKEACTGEQGKYHAGYEALRAPRDG